jgi:AcrR family transcriptional regulator
VARTATRPARPRRSPTDLTSGRANQKARTRQALVDAAMSFVREGREFSVADVADAARVGRTTAYCYFPTREALFAQAVLTLVASTDYPDFYDLFQRSSDVAARVKAVVETSDASIALHEEQYRAMLRLSLEADPADELPCRPAYRRQWLTDALEPLRNEMDGRSFDRLVAALSLCVGIEAHVSLCDVCGLTPEEARAVKLWTARALLEAAIAQIEPRGSTPQKRKSRARRTPIATHGSISGGPRRAHP